MGLHVAKIAKIIKKHDNLILGGNMLAIDPASHSLGYAYYKKGQLIDKGTLEAPSRLSIHGRLLWLNTNLKLLQDQHGVVDVLIVEEIRGRMAHAYLMWAVGMVL